MRMNASVALFVLRFRFCLILLCSKWWGRKTSKRVKPSSSIHKIREKTHFSPAVLPRATLLYLRKHACTYIWKYTYMYSEFYNHVRRKVSIANKCKCWKVKARREQRIQYIIFNSTSLHLLCVQRSLVKETVAYCSNLFPDPTKSLEQK